MKILVYALNFAPEPIGVGRYTGEMVERLKLAGHDVRVVTAKPYYPDWKIDQKYKERLYLTETWHGIKVSRAPLWVPFQPGGRARVMHLLSFSISSVPLLVRNWFWKPDIVWTVAPSLLCAPAALVTAFICRAKSWIHIQDFEVDIAFEMGIISGRASQKIAAVFERGLLGRFSVVSTISRGMFERLSSKGVPVERRFLFPNWSDLRNIAPLGRQSKYREKLDIPESAIVALYSGSMGVKQGVDWLSEVAISLKDVPLLFFVFYGDGAAKAAAQAACGGLPTVRFLPFQPIENLGELLGMADIHLLPQRPNASSLVMPSKLTGMLASGKPVLAMAEAGSEMADVVSKCGVVTAPGDLAGFQRELINLAVNAELRLKLGATASDYSNKHLSIDSVMSRLENKMRLLADPLQKKNNAMPT